MPDVDRLPEETPDVPRFDNTVELDGDDFERVARRIDEGTPYTVWIVALDPDSRVALVENRWSDGLVLPGGMAEPTESCSEAAARELREETGLSGEIRGPIAFRPEVYVRPDGDWIAGTTSESTATREPVATTGESTTTSELTTTGVSTATSSCTRAKCATPNWRRIR